MRNLFALSVCTILVAGCHGSHGGHRGPAGELSLSCSVADGVVEVTVTLVQNNEVGYLTLDDDTIIPFVEDEVFNLDLPTGPHTLRLEQGDDFVTCEVDVPDKEPENPTIVCRTQDGEVIVNVTLGSNPGPFFLELEDVVVRCDNNGEFSLGNPPPGDYIVQLTLDGVVITECEIHIPVTDPEPEPEPEPGPTPEIECVFNVEDGVAVVRVTLKDLEGPFFLSLSGYDDEVCDRDGEYTYLDLPPGEHCFIIKDVSGVELTKCCLTIPTPEPKRPTLVCRSKIHHIRGSLGHEYVLRLDGLFGPQTTFDVKGYFDEYDDGSAHLYGRARVNYPQMDNSHDEKNHWDLDVWFLSTTGPNSDYHYYVIDLDRAHQLTNRADPSDIVWLRSFPLDLSKPFQVGVGANNKNDNLGASGWVNWERSNGDGNLNAEARPCCRDFLMDLDKKCLDEDCKIQEGDDDDDGGGDDDDDDDD